MILVSAFDFAVEVSMLVRRSVTEFIGELSIAKHTSNKSLSSN